MAVRDLLSPAGLLDFVDRPDDRRRTTWGTEQLPVGGADLFYTAWSRERASVALRAAALDAILPPARPQPSLFWPTPAEEAL